MLYMYMRSLIALVCVKEKPKTSFGKIVGDTWCSPDFMKHINFAEALSQEETPEAKVG